MFVNVHEAKTQLSRLLERVERGEQIVIARAGKPVATLVPYKGVIRRVPGAWKGRVRIAEDFDELPPEIMKAFEGDAD
jgi:prevent-host-death family protein